MIVYFLRKSKVGQGIVLAALVGVASYALFVFSQVVQVESSTVQVVRKQIFGEVKAVSSEVQAPSLQVEDYAFVASKRGKYYYPKSCPKAKTLSINNMLYFKDKMAAETAGYRANSGC